MSPKLCQLKSVLLMCLCLSGLTTARVVFAETYEARDYSWGSFTRPAENLGNEDQLVCNNSIAQYKQAQAAYIEHLKKCKDFTALYFKAVKQEQLNEAESLEYGTKKNQCLQSSFYEKWGFNKLDYTDTGWAIQLFGSISHLVSIKADNANNAHKDICIACEGKLPKEYESCLLYIKSMP